ncbi:sodium:solute symporter family protein [Archaeoglobales archaeon]|nr:MAG: sodium:solute symporter family protein [Archaeoglobales archaeon]
MNSFIALIVFYAFLGTAIAIYARGARSQEEYFVGGRRISGIVSALTYASTTYSAFMMVGLVGLSYASGVGAAGFELMYLVGTLFLLSYYAPKVWKMGKEGGLVSPAELIGSRYGDITAKLSAIIALIALIPYTSIQLIGVALILEKNANLDFSIGVLIAAVLIALWAFIGGLRGVAWTDAIQGFLMLSAAILAVVWVSFKVDFSTISKLDGLLYVPNKIWTPKLFAALTIPWFFFALTNPQVFQRLFIPKDKTALRKMIIYFGLFGLIYTVLVTLLGLELKLMTLNGDFPSISYRDDVTPTLLTIMPPWLSLLIALSILAAAITTANSIILTLSSMISRDVVRERGILVGKLAVVVLTVFVALFALQKISYIVELAVLSSTILLCFLPLIIGIFHFERGGRITGVSTLLVGFIAAIALSYLKLSPLGIPASVVTFFLTFATFFVVASFEDRKVFN